jgi:hypothetical protein
MASQFPRSPKLLKGAFVEFSERFLGPIPNVIIFQYNPTAMSRQFVPWAPGSGEEPEDGGGSAGEGGADAATKRAVGTAQPFDPEESFNLSLLLDATDELETGDPITVISGVADRLSAIELLLYPQEDSLLGGLLTSAVSALGGSASFSVAQAKRGTVPITLFVWGPGRIVPVRLTSLSVEEEAFSPILYPIRATANVGLRVLHPSELENHPNKVGKAIAQAAFGFTRTQKQVLAAANIANTVDSILGMLPS